MTDELEHTRDELNRREPVCETAQELPFWKGCLWWLWGFTIGLIIGA